MSRDYDSTIEAHYDKVAHDCGLSPTSTMADSITRESETAALVAFVDKALERTRSAGGVATIVDVGCGNGYTLSVLASRWRAHRYIGIEFSSGLRALAETRFEDDDRVTILAGDIRDPDFAKGISADVLICQRVLINLLDVTDQKRALTNIARAVRPRDGESPGGVMAFIEAFSAPLARLNVARAEFDLPPLPAAHHNLYLEDDFFDASGLIPIAGEGRLAPNMLSTHYYIARVLHASLMRDRPFQRNSEFVKFFFSALRPDAGDYSPLKLFMFERGRPAVGQLSVP